MLLIKSQINSQVSFFSFVSIFRTPASENCHLSILQSPVPRGFVNCFRQAFPWYFQTHNRLVRTAFVNLSTPILSNFWRTLHLLLILFSTFLLRNYKVLDRPTVNINFIFEYTNSSLPSITLQKFLKRIT